MNPQEARTNASSQVMRIFFSRVNAHTRSREFEPMTSGLACCFLTISLLVFLMPNRIWIPQAHRITTVALHIGVFQGIVIFLREVLWQRVSKNRMTNFTRDINQLT